MGRTYQLHHLQRAMSLVNRRQTRPHAAGVVRGHSDSLKRILSLLKELEYLTLDPFQGYVILRCAHRPPTINRFNCVRASHITLGR